MSLSDKEARGVSKWVNAARSGKAPKAQRSPAEDGETSTPGSGDPTRTVGAARKRPLERPADTAAAIAAQLPVYATADDDLEAVIAMVEEKAPETGKAVKPLVLDACDALRSCIALQRESADILVLRLQADSHFAADQVRDRATSAIGHMSLGLAGNPAAVESAMADATRRELARGIGQYRSILAKDDKLQARAQAAAQAAVDTLQALRIGAERARVDAQLPDGFNAMRTADAQALLAGERLRYQSSLQEPSTLLSWYQDAVQREDEQRQLDLEYGAEGYIRGLIAGGLEALRKASRRPNALDRDGEAQKRLNDCYLLMSLIDAQRKARVPPEVALGERIHECLTSVYRCVVGIDPRHSSRALVDSVYLRLDAEGKSVNSYAQDPAWLLRVPPGYAPIGPLESDGYRRRRAPSNESPWLVDVLHLIKSGRR